jgi:pimeloyl-ACP methyl ester carboxylesterase
LGEGVREAAESAFYSYSFFVFLLPEAPVMKKFIVFRGNKIFYQATGNGPAIVLLHGFLESHAIWKNYVRKLSTSYKVITVDLPGHGFSDILSAPHSMEQMADAVRHVLKDLDTGKCLMIGHSMGGYVSLAFAEKYPGKVQGIVLFHSQAGADSPEALANRERMIGIVRQNHQNFIKNFIPGLFAPENVKKFPAEIASLKEIALKTPKEGILAALEAMRNRPDRQHLLARCKVPVLFIAGKNDSRIPMEVIIPQATLPEHSELLLLDHVGHMGFIEAPLKTYAAVKGFAERIL